MVVPTQLHEEVALQVVEAGQHMLVEKPIAADMASAMRIAAAAERTGVLLMVGHIERFNPAVRRAEGAREAGQGGRVLQLHARRVGPFPHRIRDVGVIHRPRAARYRHHALHLRARKWSACTRRRAAHQHRQRGLFAGMLHFAEGRPACSTSTG